jgi:RNA polymerase sigma-70 factor (ECF subfamily)
VLWGTTLAAVLLMLVAPSAAQERGAEDKQKKPADVKPIELKLDNPGFEKGKKAVAGWEEGAGIDGVEYIWDQKKGHESGSSLCIKKTAKRYFPIAQWHQSVKNSGKRSKLRLTVWVKAEKMYKAILDVAFAGKDGKRSHQWAAYVGAVRKGDSPADHDWKQYSGVVAIPPDTERLTIGLQVYGPGTIWFDDVKAEYVSDDTPVSLYDEKGRPKP